MEESEYLEEEYEEVEEEYVEESEYLVEEIVDDADVVEEEIVEETEYHEEEILDTAQHPTVAAPSLEPPPPPPAGGSMAAMIAMAVSNREERLGTAPVPDQETSTDSAASGGGGMAAMIAAAATNRTKRLDAGGKAKIRGEAKPAPAPSMADMIAAKATARNDRIESGGELQVRVVPEEHRNVFISIADEAAQIGQLTRLNEKVVEAIVPQKEVKEDTWVPSGLRSDNQRSKFFMVVNEAAALGQMRLARHKPHEVTNYDPVEEEESSEEEDIDNMLDEHGRRVQRAGLLMDQLIRENVKEKAKKDWALEGTTEIQYTSIKDVKLPTQRPPTWKPENKAMSQQDIKDAISNGVAAAAWDRRYRLQKKNAQLKVTRKCDCRYCVNPNPFQTHAYKKIWEDHVSNPEVSAPLPEHPKPVKKEPEWTPPKRTEPPAVFKNQPPVKKWQKPNAPPSGIRPQPQFLPAEKENFVPNSPPPIPPPTQKWKRPKPKQDDSSSSSSSSSEGAAKKKKKKKNKKDGKEKKKKEKSTRKRSRKGKKTSSSNSGGSNNPDTEVYVCSCAIL